MLLPGGAPKSAPVFFGSQPDKDVENVMGAVRYPQRVGHAF